MQFVSNDGFNYSFLLELKTLRLGSGGRLKIKPHRLDKIGPYKQRALLTSIDNRCLTHLWIPDQQKVVLKATGFIFIFL